MFQRSCRKWVFQHVYFPFGIVGMLSIIKGMLSFLGLLTVQICKGLYAVHPLGKYCTIALQNKCTSCYVHQEAFYGLALFDFIKKLLICKNYYDAVPVLQVCQIIPMPVNHFPVGSTMTTVHLSSDGTYFYWIWSPASLNEKTPKGHSVFMDVFELIVSKFRCLL